MAVNRDLPPIRPAIDLVVPDPDEAGELSAGGSSSDVATPGGTDLEELATRPMILAAPEGKTSAELDAELNPDRFELTEADLPPDKSAESQFTIKELLLVTTCAAIGMAGVRAMPGGVFLFVMQIAMIGLLVSLAIAGIAGRRVSTAYWCCVVMYLAALLTNIWLMNVC